MDRKEVIEKLNGFAHDSEDGDAEVPHILADDVLCDLLRGLGYQDVIDAYEAVNKWYA